MFGYVASSCEQNPYASKFFRWFYSMNACVIDWSVVAAWVQAIGSIGAILVAVWISSYQHKQNVKLVESERSRVQGEREAKTQAERTALRDAVMIILDPICSEASKQLVALSDLNGQEEPISASAMDKISVMKNQTKSVKLQVADLRDAFVTHPINLLVHTQLVRVLDSVVQRCRDEESNNELRERRRSQLRQVEFNSVNSRVEPALPFSTKRLEEAWQQVRNVAGTVAQYE